MLLRVHCRGESVYSSRLLGRPGRRNGSLVVSSAVMAVTSLLAATPVGAAKGKPWLQEINRYRLAAGLAPVREEPAWSAGILAHLRYLERTPLSFLTGPYRNLHEENPASPFFTKEGAAAGTSSDLGHGTSDLGAIDGWLSAPFHAIGILRPGLRRVAFARDPDTGRAGLDIIRGLAHTGAPKSPVLFPARGAATDLRASAAERPDPHETCAWTPPSGLPLIALLRRAPAKKLTATLTGPDDPLPLCAITRHTFRSSDGIYGPAARTILEIDHAVVLVPRRPLPLGTYRARVVEPGREPIAWSFAVAPTNPRLTPGLVAFSGLGPDRPVRNTFLRWPTIRIGRAPAARHYDWSRSTVRIVPVGALGRCPTGLAYRTCRGELTARRLPLGRERSPGGLWYGRLGARYTLREVVSGFRCALFPVCDVLRPGRYRLEIVLRGDPLGLGPPRLRRFGLALVIR